MATELSKIELITILGLANKELGGMSVWNRQERRFVVPDNRLDRYTEIQSLAQKLQEILSERPS